jgi:phosphatidylglycerophosphate synthase
MAPNLVTFIGFICMISSYFCMLYYDTTLSQDIPRWVFLKASIDIFIYQTLDAIDGKQARRTKSSSPLGQLFDHGCDSFSLTFFLLSVSQAG